MWKRCGGFFPVWVLFRRRNDNQSDDFFRVRFIQNGLSFVPGKADGLITSFI